MVDAINAISGVTETSAITPAQAVSAFTTTAKATVSTTEIDPETITDAQLTDSEEGFRNMLAEFFRLGYQWLSNGNMERARYYFYWYFTFLKRSGHVYDDFGTQVYGIKRYGGIMFYSMILEELEGGKTASKFVHEQFRQELLNSLRAIPADRRNRVRAFLHHLEETGELPTKAAINRPLSDATVDKIAKLYRSLHLNEWAQRFTLYSMIGHWRSLAQLDKRMADYQPNRSRGPFRFPFEHMGLPAVPFHPKITEGTDEIHKHAPLAANYFTHNIHRVDPIGKNPNDDRRRKQREQQAREQLKNTRPENPDGCMIKHVDTLG